MESYVNNMPTFGDLTNVSVEKLQELSAVLAKILALPIARDTYAQIIDGKPTRIPHSDQDKASQSQPTDQAVQEYEKIRKAFAPENLLIDLKLAQDYQNAPLNSRENHLQLLRIAAASVNALARKTYQDFHSDIVIKPSKLPELSHHQSNGVDDFYHSNYREFKRYPFGRLDIMSYWAETELFGGVVLFERDESGSNIINAFLQAQNWWRTFQLSENQIEHFAALKGLDSSAETVLPFAREADARIEKSFVRVGQTLRIYKNEYDKPAPSDWPTQSSCVIRQGDPRAASLEEAMRFIKEQGLDKKSPTFSGPFPPPPPL
ncbi:MAG: hypothetical protein ALECFALPRED_004305 [Alectoria fallacina]|uniref:Uncharacterized protein n=1 Tax=Alectoria fallacina TaxID=1903189 RepID=A0A8H3IV62_9LECA|nr:MAG: hypothetical protein ALECFALPRED_004305 [Alectoria fallacina]